SSRSSTLLTTGGSACNTLWAYLLARAGACSGPMTSSSPTNRRRHLTIRPLIICNIGVCLPLHPRLRSFPVSLVFPLAKRGRLGLLLSPGRALRQSKRSAVHLRNVLIKTQKAHVPEDESMNSLVDCRRDQVTFVPMRTVRSLSGNSPPHSSQCAPPSA